MTPRPEIAPAGVRRTGREAPARGGAVTGGGPTVVVGAAALLGGRIRDRRGARVAALVRPTPVPERRLAAAT